MRWLFQSLINPTYCALHGAIMRWTHRCFSLLATTELMTAKQLYLDIPFPSSIYTLIAQNLKRTIMWRKCCTIITYSKVSRIHTLHRDWTPRFWLLIFTYYFDVVQQAMYSFVEFLHCCLLYYFCVRTLSFSLSKPDLQLCSPELRKFDRYHVFWCSLNNTKKKRFWSSASSMWERY